jgi:phospholipid/cholesterol/gamma-HCH transport system substrate-binding protein
VIAHALVLMAKFSELLNEENQRAIGGILADTKILTGTFASRQQQFARILDSVDEFSGELKTITNSANTVAVRIDQLADEASVTLREFRTMAAGVDQVVQEDIQNLVAELRVTTEKLQSLASNANGVLRENREPLNNFVGNGLMQFTSFLTDASILVSSMTRLTERLETEGAGFLLDNNQSEFQVEN